MHDPRSEALLNGAALDREIEQLTAIDPSPEFVARVRTRLAAGSQPMSRSWRFGWAVAATAGLVVVAGVATLLISRPRAGDPRVAATGADVHLAAQSPGGVTAVERLPPSTRGAATIRTTAADQGSRREQARRELVASQATPIELPEVIVSAAEVRAFHRLLELSAGPRAIATPQVADARDEPEMDEIVILPIEIAPNPLIARLEGDAE